MKPSLIKLTIVLIIAAVFIGLVPTVLAQGSFGLEAVDSTGLGTVDIKEFIVRAVQALLGFLGIVMVAFMLFGGYVYLTAGGDPDKILKAKTILIRAILGLIIILTSFATVTYVINKSNQAMLNISGSPTACTDACLTSGVSECSGTQAYQTCGNYDEDDCLEWGEAIACTEGFECISNECQPAVLGRSCPFFAMSLNIPYLQGLSGEGPVIEQLYKEALVDLFTWSMPAGTAKWPFIHPEQDVYNPLGVQFVLDWLNNNGMSYNIFHNVVVPKIPEIPEWYWNLPTQSDRLLALEDHVQTVMAFFGDQIPIYNVLTIYIIITLKILRIIIY